MSLLSDSLKQVRSYPSAVIGAVLVASLFVISPIVMIAIPYSEALKLWRGEEGVWDESPENAAPAWLRHFQSRKLPLTIIRDTKQEGETVTDQAEGTKSVKAALKFDFPYDEPPSEVALWLHAKYKDAQPFVQLKWKRPDGEVIEFEDRTPGSTDRYQISRDQKLREKLHAHSVEEALFTKNGEVVRGTYELDIDGMTFEPDSTFDARLVVYGKLHGWAGTDNERRGLGFALLWGVPFALAFGLLAAVGTTLSSLAISAIGTWYGGLLDATIQRITEINAMLPKLVFLIMIGLFFTPNIWVILLCVILLNVFGLGIKTNRSLFLSLKEAPYIEAARAYGASNMRIIFRYLIPRVIPTLIPAFVTAVPDFVFLETTLSILGISDPNAITWGRLLHEAYTNDALYKGHYYWVLEPAMCLLVTGISFAMIGFALDRIFNPRLRNI
jgi:peptide/nickel transport system permease protein